MVSGPQNSSNNLPLQSQNFQLRQNKTPEVYGPPETIEAPPSNYESDRFQPDGEQFQEAPLKERIIDFVGNLETEEQILLGGAVSAGALASGKLKFTVPVEDNLKLGVKIRTQSNQAARDLQNNPFLANLPNAKTPEGAGFSVTLSKKF